MAQLGALHMVESENIQLPYIEMSRRFLACGDHALTIRV